MAGERIDEPSNDAQGMLHCFGNGDAVLMECIVLLADTG